MYVDINAAGCPNTCRHCSVDGHSPHGRLFALDELRQLKAEWGPLTIRFEPTARAWLEKWRQSPTGDEFKHPFEPPAWPPSQAFEHLSLRITRERKVYLDPLCAPPVYLGTTSEGKANLLHRLETLPAPPHADLSPDDIQRSPDEQEQLHPSGFSLRYKEINQRYQARL